MLSLKESGSRLAQAIARVQEEPADARSLSVYGELRRAQPHLGSRLMGREVLMAISRAIEDEALARAVRPMVFGAFQREEFYRRSSPRWQELARTSEQCVVFADFATSDAAGEPVRVALDPASPLLREWAVVVCSADFSVVLTAWEVPDDPGRRLRGDLHPRAGGGPRRPRRVHGGCPGSRGVTARRYAARGCDPPVGAGDRRAGAARVRLPAAGRRGLTPASRAPHPGRW